MPFNFFISDFPHSRLLINEAQALQLHGTASEVLISLELFLFHK